MFGAILILLFIVALLFGLTQKYPEQWMTLQDIFYVYVIATSATVAFGIGDKLCHFQNVLKNPQNRDGHIAIVTGGGRGIGLEVVKGLMKSGMTVVMAVRNPEACKRVLGDLSEKYPKGNVLTMKLDVSSMESVKEFVKNFSADYSKLHILVNNAGAFPGEYKKTEEGFEENFATNYLGHFLLTHLLMDKMKAAGEESELFSRVVNVSSCAHFFGQMNWEDINMEKHYCNTSAYTQSKLAQVLFSHRLDTSLVYYEMPVRSNAVNPGIAGSELFASVLKILGSWSASLKYIVRTPRQAATSVLYTCLSPVLERQGGKYISSCGEGYTNAITKIRMEQDRFFKQTMTMLDIQQFGAPVGYYSMANPEKKKPIAVTSTAYSL